MPQNEEDIKKELSEGLKNISGIAELEALRERFFSRKSGKITLLMKELSNATAEERKILGARLNNLKNEIENLFNKKRDEFFAGNVEEIKSIESIDVTQPSIERQIIGHLHPLSIVQHDLEDFFSSMGFMVLDGPELESEYYNFTAVNIPPEHPARDMQDTFFIKGRPGLLMRTHTSSVQVRAMREYGAPLRAIVPGRCFRNEATDARHEHTLYQLEGFAIDRNISFSHLKGVLEAVAKHLYGEAAEVRMRPKFYPFVEPGVNGEVTCFLCDGVGCRVCKKSGWIEIFGAGMIHPNVLKAGGINPKTHAGFAFGFGLSRLVMLKYGIEDVRYLQSGDLRFLNQF